MVKAVFSWVMCTHCTMLPRVNCNISRFRELLVLLARKFELTKTSCESLLAAYDCWLAHPTSLYTPPGGSLNFAGRGCLSGAECSYPLVKCMRSVGDRFCLACVYPKSRSLQRLKGEVWTYAENSRETDLKRRTDSQHTPMKHP